MFEFRGWISNYLTLSSRSAARFAADACEQTMNRFDASVNTASTVPPEQFPALNINMAMIVPDRVDNPLFRTYLSGGNQDTADYCSDSEVEVLSPNLDDEYYDAFAGLSDTFAGFSTSPGVVPTTDEGTFEGNVEVSIESTTEEYSIEDASEELQSLIASFSSMNL